MFFITKKMIEIESLFEILENFNQQKILVIGDLILDKFIWGEVNRISPEAPVPVVKVKKESFAPGGSLNVANNIHSLNGQPYVVGVIGDDLMGNILISKLKEKGIETEGLIIDKQRPTTLKTRIVAHSQQVVRVDYEETEEINDETFDKISSYIKKIIKDVKTIVISDYGKGVITSQLLHSIFELNLEYQKYILVDPKVNHFELYKHATLITPNHYEASTAAKIQINDEKTLLKAGKKLLSELELEALIITRSENGLSLFEKNGDISHIPTVAKEVYDVSGAGDTVIATCALSLVAGSTLKQAAYLSNCAGGIVVGKLGVATLTKDELKQMILELNKN